MFVNWEISEGMKELTSPNRIQAIFFTPVKVFLHEPEHPLVSEVVTYHFELLVDYSISFTT